MATTIDVFPSFHEDVTRSVITVLTPLLTGITDETGQAYSVPIRSDLSDDALSLPEVTVRVRLGRMKGMMGLNRWAQGKDGNQYSMVMAPGSRIVLDVRGRSDPERLFIADSLISGIWAAAGVDQFGFVREAIIQLQLEEAGITLIAIDEPDYPPPALDEARPESLQFTCTVPLLCDLRMTWTTGTTSAPSIQSTQTLTGTPTVLGPPPLIEIDPTLTF